MQDVSKVDLELLEVLTLQVPWYMICGEFATRYGGPEQLAERLITLRNAKLIKLRDTVRAEHQITAAELVADAIDNNCYAELEETREPQWDMMATDAGYALVEARLDRE
jgi:hypothetical protein